MTSIIYSELTIWVFYISTFLFWGAPFARYDPRLLGGRFLGDREADPSGRGRAPVSIVQEVFTKLTEPQWSYWLEVGGGFVLLIS